MKQSGSGMELYGRNDHTSDSHDLIIIILQSAHVVNPHVVKRMNVTHTSTLGML